MPISEPALTIGIEEEYLLVERDSRDLVKNPSEEMFKECEARLKSLVKPEFLKSQIEVATDVCGSIAEARRELGELRSTIAEVAGKYDLAPIAASTHPFARWEQQVHTDKDRYNALARDLQAVARRLVICGMHVHVCVDDEDLRIDLMSQAAYFLPHLMALSTSSPFWGGEKTGLMSYRLCVWDELPRTGLPERFDSYGEYLRHVNVMIDAGLIEDATMIWWDIRPSARFPTLEMRISDICTRIEDTITIAALYVCIIRMLYRLRSSNQRWRSYSNMLVAENRWRAHRFGLDEGLVDFGKGSLVPFADLVEELLELIREDAEALDCVAEVEHARTIIERGTSAHRQIAAFDDAVGRGASPEEALRAVVDDLIEQTVAGL